MSLEENPGGSLNTLTAPELHQENSLSPAPAVAAPVLSEENPSPPENGGVEPEPSTENSSHSPIPVPVPEVQIELPNIDPEAVESVEVESMLADMEKLAAVPQGKVVKGKVVRVTDVEVRMSVGTGLEGVVPLSEFLTGDGQATVAPGDEVGVWVDRYNEKQGTVTLSRLKAVRLEVWERIERAFTEQTAITGRVLDRIKGGLTVDIGVHAFLPSSQADIRPLRNVDSLLGQNITCKVIKLIRKRSNVVVSRKLVLEEEANGLKAKLLERLQEGGEFTGRVKNLTEYGAFVDLGGMDGLLHVTDMSWARVTRPAEVVQVGQEIKVKILKFDAEKGRVSLGMKQLLPDPWERVPSAYHAGDRLTGRVANVTDYGVFVELEPGIEGLVHISELSWSKRPKHPSKIVNAGDQVEVAVLAVDQAQRRVSLSLKQTMPDPWNTVVEKYSAGSTVEATVSSLTDFGAFAEIDADVEGLVRNADLSWTKKVKHPSEVLKKGQKIAAVILSVDSEHRRLALGMKQLQPDPWDGFIARIHAGEMVKARVARLAPFGAFVEIEEGIEGLCHNSEFGNHKGPDGKPKLDIGSELEFRVIRLDPVERKISLSLKVLAPPSPPPVRSERKKEGATNRSTPSGPPKEIKKKPEPLTTMAEALSAAGITTSRTPKPQPSTAIAKAEKKSPVTAEESSPPSSPSQLVKAELETAVAAEEPAIPTPVMKVEPELVATMEESASPAAIVKAEPEPASTVKEAAEKTEEKAAVAGGGPES
ncbi:MAG TPA: S1 RNA-binding domain-containing protein [Terriglobia bacterium]|nr:S1 RNA-binding domain-containing protein [Terriglobia bacterium]